MEKLVIEDFAGLKHVDLVAEPVTLLIGPQATGKSVIAKLLYFFREIAARLPTAAAEEKSADDYLEERRQRFCRYFPPDNWGRVSFRLSYQSNEQYVIISHTANNDLAGQTELEVKWSDFYETTLLKFSKKRKDLLADRAEGDRDTLESLRPWRKGFDEALTKALGPWGKFEQIFIPAGRAFFAQVKASVFTTLEEGEAIDPFLAAFGSLLERSKQVLQERGFFSASSESTIEKDELRTAFSQILRADLIRQEKVDYLRFADGRKVRLTHASSGQQEALPLLLLLARFVSLRHASGRAVYLEEPEAHLFPTTQRHIVEFMGATFRARHDQMRLVVTTHSPYILTAFNNLLQAGLRYKELDPAGKQRLMAIIHEDRVLYPGEVAAYALDNGTAKSIIDNETELIDAQILDAVSTDLAKEFDRLLWESK